MASAPPLVPAPPRPAPPPPSPPPPGRNLLWRLVAGAVAVVVLSGTATALFALNEIHKILEALGQHKPVRVSHQVLTPVGRGKPETLLLVGNDERPETRYYHQRVLPHSNEMLLVRIDPSQPTISMLSVPRELLVTFTTPDGETVTTRLNAAYMYGYIEGGGTAGGIQLLVETLKRVLGIPEINHVFVTNFPRFENAVNEMGCVYMMVDKRYEHTNEPGNPEQYMEIHLQSGYQRLCGREAREFVSNRHESTSLVRDARDQRFLLEVKAQYGPKLFEEREKFERIFGKAVESDLQQGEQGEEEVLDLLQLLIESSGKPVRQVQFPVELHPTYDTATPAQIEQAVNSFLHGTAAIPTHSLNQAVRSVHVHSQGPTNALSALGLAPTPTAFLEEAKQKGANLPFALEVPLFEKTTAEAQPNELRTYEIEGPHGSHYPAYVEVISTGELGQFYDVEGTSWSDPPLFNAPFQTLRIGHRTYNLYYDGEKIKTIAWREGGGTYWIENTLSNTLDPETMVAIARETKPLTPGLISSSSAGTLPVPAHNVTPPPRPLPTVPTAVKVADYLSFPLAVALFVLGGLVVWRFRSLSRLRQELAARSGALR